MIRAILIAVALSTFCAERKAEPVHSSMLTIQLTAARKELHLQADRPLVFNQGHRQLPPGAYTIQISNTHPARQRFRLFAKTFPPNETQEAKEYAAQWKAQGYEAEILPFGRAWKLDSGAMADNRNQWISIARLPTLDKAKALKAELEKQKVWAWMVPETAEQGGGKLHFKDAHGKEVLKVEAPFLLQSDAPIRVSDVDIGFWKDQKQARAYRGTLEVRVGPDAAKQGFLELYEHVDLESYLAGVLPAEMPAGWPLEALKAQAVAARSDVAAALGGKHALEGFDFCGGEHCRAYGGEGGRQKSTDDAVAATRGLVLVAEGRVVPAVFSANCGGWTENNDTVWSSPPNKALRGVPDFAAKKNPAAKGPEAYGMAKWLTGASQAFCAGEPAHYRWVKRFTAKELSDCVNKRYPVGQARSIELGERGSSGRLKWVKVIGTKKTQVIRKDLDIRLAFGGLNSAMFMVEAQGRPGSPDSFTFTGGGRGHGVGLCQDGARGMADAGMQYRDILKHYFAVATLARLP